MSHYTVTAQRSGKWWSLQALEAPGALSQVARLDQAEEAIREAISFVTGEPERDIEVTVQPVMPAGAQEHLDEAVRQRHIKDEANSRAAQETRSAVQAMRSSGFTVRDVGAVMGVSFQRAQQLSQEAQRSRVST